MSRLRPTNHDQRITIASWLQENTAKLREAGIQSARLDCLILLEKVLGKERPWIAAHGDEILLEKKRTELTSFVTQREKRIPLAYILGSKEFYGTEFLVNKDVLIPRPESEAIIALLKEVVGSIPHKVNTIIDVGTGSGCLAIIAKKEFPDVHVTGVDISDAALKIARKNARLHNTQIQWKIMDIQNELPKLPKTRPYLLLANLPYVPDELITSVEITKEPPLALFSGSDGLCHYRALWQQINLAKHRPLAVITESLTTQHKQTEHLANMAGYHLQKTTDLIQLFILESKV